MSPALRRGMEGRSSQRWHHPMILLSNRPTISEASSPTLKAMWEHEVRLLREGPSRAPKFLHRSAPRTTAHPTHDRSQRCRSNQPSMGCRSLRMPSFCSSHSPQRAHCKSQAAQLRSVFFLGLPPLDCGGPELIRPFRGSTGWALDLDVAQ